MPIVSISINLGFSAKPKFVGRKFFADGIALSAPRQFIYKFTTIRFTVTSFTILIISCLSTSHPIQIHPIQIIE